MNPGSQSATQHVKLNNEYKTSSEGYVYMGKENQMMHLGANIVGHT